MRKGDLIMTTVTGNYLEKSNPEVVYKARKKLFKLSCTYGYSRDPRVDEAIKAIDNRDYHNSLIDLFLKSDL